ncbi:MAG TPA: GAF domain-containing protein [Ktedonobacteraceae bacterium]|nr:GAF domain-containing protein [Ktedonobacteraceae bacterium]
MTTDSRSTDTTARTHKDYYTALHQAALTISSSLELEQVLQSVVTSITEAMEVKGCVLRLLDAHTGSLQIAAVYGLSRGYLAKGPVDVNHSLIDSETLCGTPVFIPDVRTDERFQYKDAAKNEGIVSVLCVPLEVRGNAIGVLRVYTGELRTFHEDDIQFMTVLASLAALAIENANLYESLKQSYDGVMEVLWGTSLK